METELMLSTNPSTPENTAVPASFEPFEISVAKDVLSRALSHIYSVVERRNTIAILSNVKIEARDNFILLTATDMDITVIETIPASVIQKGSITIQAHTLYDVVRKAQEETISITSTPEKPGQVTVLCGSSNFTLLTLPAQEFPNSDAKGTSHDFFVSAAEFQQLLEKTHFAASTEETRYYLNGIYLHAFQGDSPALRSVATDGHRLAFAQISLPQGAEQIPGIIVPRKTVNELRKILSGTDIQIKVSLSQTKLVIETDTITVVSKLIDGTYPDYNRVIPKNNDKIMEVSTQQFMQAVDRISTVSSEKTRGIKANINPGTMTLSAAREDNHAGQEQIELSYSATPLDVGFNSRYLMDVLSHIEGDTVQFTFADNANPVLIRDTSNVGVLFVIMPMRV